eukprot:GHVH01000003.1.p1 GENE.GHVH01000003.1~~GHVH01000003.1.p1  ORF type:complete len:266 (-),score=21.56 GHVH01000003.1:74-871(-)
MMTPRLLIALSSWATLSSATATEPPIVRRFEDHPFFYPSNWIEGDSCYYEFFEGTKQDWADCCVENVSSINCMSYFPDDVCYDAMVNGSVGITSGWIGDYITPGWSNCCAANCTSNDCYPTAYCLPEANYIVYWYTSWFSYVVASFFCLFIMAFCLSLCYFCGSMCQKSKVKKPERKPQPRSTTQTSFNAAAVAVAFRNQQGGVVHINLSDEGESLAHQEAGIREVSTSSSSIINAPYYAVDDPSIPSYVLPAFSKPSTQFEMGK